MVALMEEYTHRYGKHHATERLKVPLSEYPKAIPVSGLVLGAFHCTAGFDDPPQCMPKACKGEDTVLAYQNYYIIEKSGFARWTKRETPAWFIGETGAKGKSLELHNTENA